MTAPLILALETATRRASAALHRGEDCLALRTAERGMDHSESLLALVDAVLADAGTELSAVEGFALAIGPGSFTSLRIGLATVKGLAFGRGAVVAPVSTLAAAAVAARAALGEADAAVAPLLDARRGEFYAAVYAGPSTGETGEPQALVGEGVYAPPDLAPSLPQGCRLVGEGAPLFRELQEEGGLAPAELGPVEGIPRADAVGVLGARLLARHGGVAAEELAPRYVRRAQAEAVRLQQPYESDEGRAGRRRD